MSIFLHAQHRGHDPLGLSRGGVHEHLDQRPGHDLHETPVPILEPAALLAFGSPPSVSFVQ